MKKLITILSVLVLTVLTVSFVNAQGPNFGKGHRMFSGDERWSNPTSRIPNLTDEQKGKLQELKRKFIEETAQLRGNIMSKRLELKSLWADPKADPNAIRAKERELRELQNQLRDKVLENRLEVRKILTPEQISEFGFGRGFGPKFGCGYGMVHGKRAGYGFPMRCW